MLTARAYLFLALVAIGGCESQHCCVQVGEGYTFGRDPIQKMNLLYSRASDDGLPFTKDEAALIVGWAYAASQVEGGQKGVPVEICLRASFDKEFRVRSINGKVLLDWRVVEVPELSPANQP